MQYKNYGVIGRPISHSLSIAVHSIFSLQAKLATQYNRLLAQDKRVVELAGRLVCKGGGANITSPFKNLFYSLCHSASCRAMTSRSTNTLKFYKGKIYGDSTDGVGLVQDIRNRFLALTSKTLIILGSGGSVSSILFNILNERPKHVSVQARNRKKLRMIFGRVKQYVRRMQTALTFSLLDQHQEPSADILISTIPVNFFQAKGPACGHPNLGLVYDIKYQPHLTGLMVSALELGLRASNGLGMLVHQASESSRVWSAKRLADKIIVSIVHSFMSFHQKLEGEASDLSIASAHFRRAQSVQSP